MEIIIDYREKSIHELITKLDNPCCLKITTDNLALGDILIKKDKTLLLFERKSLNDLSASIKDGRYKEQSHRLNNCEIHNHNIYYIIEGNMSIYNKFKSKNNVQSKVIMSSLCSLNYFKGFSVIKTNDANETAEVIMAFANKINKENKQPYYQNTTDIIDESNKESNIESNKEEYTTVHKNVKKNNITIDNISEIFLCQIPHVSSVIAIAVMAKFKTLQNLITNLNTDVTCLDDIVTGIKPRKISKLAKSNIFTFLLQTKQ